MFCEQYERYANYNVRAFVQDDQTMAISYPMMMTKMVVYVFVTFSRLFPLRAGMSKQRGLLIMKSLSADSKLTVDIYFFMF